MRPRRCRWRRKGFRFGFSEGGVVVERAQDSNGNGGWKTPFWSERDGF